MGKGVVPDSHSLNISAARSMALQQADTVILLGARLNWILHFGLPPRFNKDVKVVQVDIAPEEHSQNVESYSELVGDCKFTVKILNEALKGFKFGNKKWVDDLKGKCQKN